MSAQNQPDFHLENKISPQMFQLFSFFIKVVDFFSKVILFPSRSRRAQNPVDSEQTSRTNLMFRFFALVDVFGSPELPRSAFLLWSRTWSGSVRMLLVFDFVNKISKLLYKNCRNQLKP